MIRNELLRLNQIVKSIDINNKEARIQINMRDDGRAGMEVG